VRLEREAREGRRTLTPDERWALVGEMPECKEHSRLAKLQEPFDGRMEVLIKQMWQLPARTAEGRRAKAMVLLFCVLGPDWQQSDAETDYAERHAHLSAVSQVSGSASSSWGHSATASVSLTQGG
jgi:hypothetical protein